MLRTLVIGLLLLPAFVSPVRAAMADFAPQFEINLEEDELPTYDELKKSFHRENNLYDTKYNSVFDLTGEFDREFYEQTALYGANEKRLKWVYEDNLLQMIQSLPKEMYQYIGPMLFTVPAMSEKILNLPGIKETKNQFPTRIAPQLKDIEDLEFMSPFFYFLLMPEMWPENSDKFEFPQMQPVHPKVVYDPAFYQAVRRLVPPEKYMPEATTKDLAGRSMMRTIFADKNTLLTAADVEAVINTLDAVNDWGKQNHNLLKIYTVTTLWLNYDRQQPGALAVPALKDIVNPCSRLVQKATILGQERELALIAAKEGFSLNEWAYTCDKTLKAYRLSRISPMLMTAIRGYQRGFYDAEIDKLSPKHRDSRYATMQAIAEMYKAPLSDVMEVKKKRPLLEEKLLKHDFKLVGAPVARLD